MDENWRKDPSKRAAASKHLRVAGDQALHANRSAEDLQAENAQAAVLEGGIPVMWGNSAGQKLRGRNASIQTPSAGERHLGAKDRPTCSMCVHFDVKNGRKAIVEQRFAETLVLEHEWALRHIGGSVDHLALCGDSGGELCVTSMSPACPNFRERKGKL